MSSSRRSRNRIPLTISYSTPKATAGAKLPEVHTGPHASPPRPCYPPFTPHPSSSLVTTTPAAVTAATPRRSARLSQRYQGLSRAPQRSRLPLARTSTPESRTPDSRGSKKRKASDIIDDNPPTTLRVAKRARIPATPLVLWPQTSPVTKVPSARRAPASRRTTPVAKPSCALEQGWMKAQSQVNEDQDHATTKQLPTSGGQRASTDAEMATACTRVRRASAVTPSLVVTRSKTATSRRTTSPPRAGTPPPLPSAQPIFTLDSEGESSAGTPERLTRQLRRRGAVADQTCSRRRTYTRRGRKSA